MINESPTESQKLICTLSSDDRVTQESEWVTLCANATSITMRDDGAVADFALDIADELQALVDAERSCCGSWLDLQITHDAESMQVGVIADSPEGVALVHELLGRNR